MLWWRWGRWTDPSGQHAQHGPEGMGGRERLDIAGVAEQDGHAAAFARLGLGRHGLQPGAAPLAVEEGRAETSGGGFDPEIAEQG